MPGAKQSSRARSPSASNKPIAILFPGETGVGKVTFVSGTVNRLGLGHLPETAEEVSRVQRVVPMKLVLLDENHAEATARVGPSDDNGSTENASVSVTRIQSYTHLTRLAPGCSSQTRQGWGHRGLRLR